MASKPVATTERIRCPPAGTAGCGPRGAPLVPPRPVTDFESILFEDPDAGRPARRREAPGCLRDLGLDQVIATLTAGREAYDLTPLFHTRLREPRAVAYRQEVMGDLERGPIREVVVAFARAMGALREQLEAAERLDYAHQRNRWFLDAVRTYGEAVEGLAAGLAATEPRSRGLRALRAHLAAYVCGEPFRSLLAETAHLEAALGAVRYCLRIRGDQVTVLPYAGQGDYGAVVERAFARLRDGPPGDDPRATPGSPMNHVEGRVLALVARLNPEVFAALAAFRERRAGFLDPRLVTFDREVQFYLAYLEHTETLRRAGLELCYPRVSDRDRRIEVRGTFDLALAARLIAQGREVVPNDLVLEDGESIAVITGPNQGGKTTFARTIGQLHYLASLGLPVPGRAARLFLCDRLLTHFAREEEAGSERGRLLDELVRMRRILEQASAASLIIANEPFASTTLSDATFLSQEVARRILGLGARCVWVTFVDPIARLGEGTASLVATVDPDRPTERTYRIERRPPDGLAYALALARSHGLTYEQLRERLRR